MHLAVTLRLQPRAEAYGDRPEGMGSACREERGTSASGDGGKGGERTHSDQHGGERCHRFGVFVGQEVERLTRIDEPERRVRNCC